MWFQRRKAGQAAAETAAENSRVKAEELPAKPKRVKGPDGKFTKASA